MKSHILISIVIFFIISPAYAGQNIVILGDSLSTGYGLKPKQSWVNIMDQKLKKYYPKANLINLSQSGRSTREGVGVASKWLHKYKPDILIIALGGNDILQGQNPITIKNNLETVILSNPKYECILLVEVPVPPHYPKRYRQNIKSNMDELSKNFKGVTLIGNFLDQAYKNKHFQKDGIHPSSEAQSSMATVVWKSVTPMLDQCLTKQ